MGYYGQDLRPHISECLSFTYNSVTSWQLQSIIYNEWIGFNPNFNLQIHLKKNENISVLSNL